MNVTFSGLWILFIFEQYMMHYFSEKELKKDNPNLTLTGYPNLQKITLRVVFFILMFLIFFKKYLCTLKNMVSLEQK